MKVFVLLEQRPFEGFDYPIGVYSTEDLATRKKVEAIGALHPADNTSFEIVPYELDGERVVA